MKSRDLYTPRIRPGMVVRYDAGKWEACANAVRFNAEWAAGPSYTRVGVTVPPAEFSGHIYPATHPWGLPDYATPVRWRDTDRVGWVRTSCVDVIEEEVVIKAGQQMLLLCGCEEVAA